MAPGPISQPASQPTQAQAPAAAAADISRWLSREGLDALKWQVCRLEQNPHYRA